MAVAVPLEVPDADRGELRSWVRSPSLPSGLVTRARIVLLAAEGVPNAEIARRLQVSRQTVVTWRNRFRSAGLAGLEDRPRSGRPVEVDEAQVVVCTLRGPPERLGVTHWSSRLLAAELGISNVAIAKVWRKWKIQPWRSETFEFSTDPELEAKVRDVVGLYLAPPDKAVVVCVDEKSQIQALDRTAPMLPVRPGLAERRTHDYLRHGTTTLFAALEVATGRITADVCYDRHRSEEFLRFLKAVAEAHPRVKLHVVVDNYATHKHPRVKAWLARNPRITLHFTPTGCSWLNLVEIFFGIITRQAIRRGTFTSVPDLIAAIGRYIDAYNQRCRPFTWTKTADEILEHATPHRPQTSFTRH
ncbi:IS630 family transposase [Actinomadura rubrisoli]|uniref:IS630 family transposase n=1 Tax=Actinomadura rubrisoli TaxID=2530368 RepID=A0A4R5B0G9_9ACTN|nr:IS630 family transposase [Actinomadura rubrisoli]TDD79051.1 IS630 family transposase [Actinomadura rubrisoli]